MPDLPPIRGAASVLSESMATVRLFAGLREVAGTSRLDLDGDTVGEVVDAAIARFGPDFAALVPTARVWRNGEEAEASDPVASEDEVALLPPVSGGSLPLPAGGELSSLIPLGAGALLVVANLASGPEWWAAAIVGVGAVWAADVAGVLELRRRVFPLMAVLFALVAGVIVVNAVGPIGLGLGLAIALVGTMGWGIGIPGYREIDTLSPAVLVSLVLSLGAGSLALARSEASPDERAVAVFLVVAVAATLAGVAADRAGDLPFLDPFAVTAFVAVLASVAAAMVWDLDVVGYLVVGIGLAIAFVAGRGLGSILRTGRVSLSERSPGLMTAVDGAVLAAALYFPLISLVL